MSRTSGSPAGPARSGGHEPVGDERPMDGAQDDLAGPLRSGAEGHQQAVAGVDEWLHGVPRRLDPARRPIAMTGLELGHPSQSGLLGGHAHRSHPTHRPGEYCVRGLIDPTRA